MRRHGEAYTPNILDEIVEKNLEHPDLQSMMKPAAAIDDTKTYWSGGMPEDFIGIGSDCMGNLFGFARQKETVDDAPVFFFDHDFVDVAESASSFDAFLAWYLDHLDQTAGGGP